MSKIAHILQKLEDVPALSHRPMCGGYCLYSEGKVFAFVDGERIFLKGDEISQPLYERADGEQFIFIKNGAPLPMRYWWVDPQRWSEFLPIALETAHRAPPPKRKSKRV